MDENELRDLLVSLNILSDLRQIEFDNSKKSSKIIFQGSVELLDSHIVLKIEFDDFFPLHLPKYYWVNFQEYDICPHIEDLGKVCYAPEIDLLIDVNNPFGIIQKSLQSVINNIERGLKHENIEDFSNEFEAYWKLLNSNINIISNLTVSTLSSAREIKIGFRGGSYIACNNEEELLYIYRRLRGSDKGVRSINALFIPLENANQIIPPTPETLWGAEEIKHLFENYISERDRQYIFDNGLLFNNSKVFVIFRLSQSNGQFALFGIQLLNKQSRKRIRSKISLDNCDFKPCNVVRLDHSFLLNRSGGFQSMKNKNILLVGAGSVGGYIAVELVKAGVTNLTIVDNDLLELSNIHRHVLGRSYEGLKKVIGLKKFIEENYIHSNVIAQGLKLEYAIRDGKINLSQFDCIISAVGNPTINHYLNKVVCQNNGKIPLVICWNDPYGIGGHTLATNISECGCFACLYSEDWHNEASFTARDQSKPFQKSVSGCGTLFTPFGSVDSINTAIQTIRVTINVIEGKISKNTLVSWKGDTTTFREEGFKTSSRFDLSTEELNISGEQFYNSNCQVCNLIKT